MRRVGTRQRIVEQDQDVVAGEALDGALELVDQGAERVVILAQHRHHLLGLGRLGEGREVAQVAEHDGHLAAMTPEHVLVA